MGNSCCTEGLRGPLARSREVKEGFWFNPPKPLPPQPAKYPITLPEPGVSPNFPFENLVFEGGGCKGTIYGGVLKEVEARGGMKHAKRFAGASAGSFIAAFLAIGMTADEIIEELVNLDFAWMSGDESWGPVRDLMRLNSEFGLHAGVRMFEWFGDLFEKRTGSRDITFKQVFERYGRELVAVGANISNQAAENFHMKTTPNMPIRRALRISGSFPFFFSAWREADMQGNMNVYTDGGCYCNFPVHVFDGWFLSMKPEDSYLNRLSKVFKNKDAQQLDTINESRFKPSNSNTIGFKLADDSFCKFWLPKMLSEFPDVKWADAPIPDSAKGKEYKAQDISLMATVEKGQKAGKELEELITTLQKLDTNGDGKISRSELEKGALQGASFLPFTDLEDLLGVLDKDGDGMISVQEICAWIMSHGFDAMARISGTGRNVEINTPLQFVGALLDSFHNYTNRVLAYDAAEFRRACVINAKYVTAMDMSLEDGDKKWMIAQGQTQSKIFFDAVIGKR